MYTFNRRYSFGRVEYKIDHEDESKTDEHKHIDYEYLRRIQIESENHKNKSILVSIIFFLCLGLSIANGIALSSEAYPNLFGNTLAMIFEIILILLTFGFLIYMGSCFDDDSVLRELEELYILTDAGQVQYLKEKEKYDKEEQEKVKKKADNLITTYDTLDSNIDRERKIKIISEIIKDMEE